MYELNPGDYEKARPIFQKMGHHLILESVLAGATRAMIRVDDLENPRAALCHYKDRFYLLGESDERSSFNRALEPLLDEVLAPQAEQDGRDWFVVYPSSEAWFATVAKLLDGRPSWQAQRQTYRLTALDQQRRATLPKGMNIRRIDEAFLTQTHLAHHSEVVEEIQSERDSVADFLAKSFGFCAVSDNDIAGLITSEYNTGTRCEVGIMTMEGYQRQGVATALGNTLADYAFSNGITEIGWHCWARNTASSATALKIGFQPVHEEVAFAARYVKGDAESR